MKIDQLHVDAFGQFEDFDLRLRPGLNLLYGPNEAGKSTLLSFVRAVLFGFERKSSPARYQPEDGQPGGYLQLSTGIGPIRVRRKAGRRQEGDVSILGPEGEPLETEKLAQALEGVSRDLFFEVFAFGLSELSTFERLANESTVSEALFAAGVQGAKRFPEAMDRLRKSTESLYSPRGRKPLNAVLSELAAVQEQLRGLGSRPKEYFELSRQAGEIDRALDELEEKLAAGQTEQNRLRGLLQNVRGLEELEAAAQRFASAESFADFPEAAEALLDQRLSAVAAAEEEQRQIDREMAAINEELAASYISLPAAPNAGENINKGPGDHRRLVELRQQLAQAEQALGSVETILAAARKERERVEEVVRRQTAVQQRLPGTPLENLHRLLGAVRRAPSLQAELGTLEALRSEKERAAADLRSNPPTPPELPFRSLAFAAWVAAAFALAALSFLLHGFPFYLGVGFGLGLGTSLWLIRRRALRSQALALAQYSDQERARAARLARVEGEIASIDQLRQKTRSALEEAQSELGLTGGSAEDWAARGESIELQIKQVEKRIELSGELEKVTAELSVALRSEREAQANRVVAEALLSRLKRELNSFLEQEGFPVHLSPQEAIDAWQSRTERRGRLAMLEAPQQRTYAMAEKAKRELDELRRLGKATSPEDFRARAQRARQWRDERRRWEEQRHQLEGAAGVSLAELRSCVERGMGIEALQAAAVRNERELVEAAARKRQLAEELGGIRQKLAEWEKDEEASRLRAQEESLRAKAFGLADRYAVDRLAMKLLIQAREEFHARYQPALIQRASAVFSELTSGRYRRILLEPGQSELVVREREGTQRQADALSRGTREQLYLAFRIAVIEDFSQRRCPLPVLVDDIWVNFDRKRAASAIAVFARLAQAQQVVAFTCHEHIRELFRRRGASCIDLGENQQLFLRLHSA